VRTRSGEILTVTFQHTDGRFRDVHPEGEARLIYSGVITPEAWR
jgi:hypothetical protein